MASGAYPDRGGLDGDNQLVTLGAIGSTLTIPNLDGNSDGGYLIDFMLATRVAASSVAMTLNGATTNLISRGLEQSSTDAPARVASSSTWNVADVTVEADDFIEGRLWLPSKARGADTRRAGWLDVYFGTGPTTRHMWFLYNDGTTNITSLAFVGVGTNVFKAISYANVRKMRMA